MEEPGSIDYVAEGEAMRIYGFIGCALYVLAFCPILYSLYKRKQSIVECIYLYSANANITQTSGMRSLRI